MLSPIGATIAGLALALGGTAAAAYSGALPAPAQDIAHTVIGAPAARTTTRLMTATGTPSQDPSPTGIPRANSGATGIPVGPDASGPAAFGLCTAWTQHQSNGASTHGTADDSVAFKDLATAAGGADKIAAYCATILSSATPRVPGAPVTEPTRAMTTHPTGKPTSLPTQASINHPVGKPTTLPSKP